MRSAATPEPANGADPQSQPTNTQVGRSIPPVTPQPIEPVAAPPSIVPGTMQADAERPLLAVRRTALPPGMRGSAILVPFPEFVGAASFQRGADTIVVFDAAEPFDMAGLRDDPDFGSAQIQQLPAATLLRLHLPRGVAVALWPDKRSWVVAAVSNAASPKPIAPRIDTGHLDFPAEKPGAVVSLADPGTGTTLLVGTQHRAGQAVLTGWRTPGFNLLPTSQGVAIEPLSDAVTLRIGKSGFVLDGPANGLALSPPPAGGDMGQEAERLTRRFAFPAMPVPSLARRVQELVVEAAATPPLARGPRRVAAAQAMLALGLAAEAEALLHLAAAQDPREGKAADTIGLTAIAAMLAGHIDAADGIEDPRLSGSDEVAFWRGIRLALKDRASAQAAQIFAATSPLILLYPAAIQRHVFPLVAETMIRGGATEPARRLLAQRPDDLALRYANAMLLQADGKTTKALALYDKLANGRDRSDSARAAVRAVELRLTADQITTAQAADRLDAQLYAWRGDSRELALRLRVAALRVQSGQWKAALALLRETETLFPTDAPVVHAKRQQTFAALLRDGAADSLSPLEFVSIVDASTDLMPATAEGDAMEERLADKLLALDLPKRAGQVLDKLMRAAPTGSIRAGFGARLAALLARNGDLPAALAALDASTALELPPSLRERRALLRSSILARQGDRKAAIAAVADVGSPAGDEARAAILEENGDWPAAEQALTAYAQRTIPANGTIDDGQRRTLLRLATAAARAGDDAALSSLRAREDARMGTGPLAELFRLMTAPPVRDPADLARAGREIGLARALPADLQALRAVAKAR